MAHDYKKLGLKAGLEIHQQLDTTKLFCSCPSRLRDNNPDTFVKRKLRPVASELGKIDVAAAFERSKERTFIYEFYDDTTCLVELDEEPPQLLDKEALKIALQVSLMFNAKPVDEIQVMRKTIIDGSNTSGFQRTALIARNGYIETSFGKVGIEQVCLEEDSARRVAESKNSVTFRLDRLGIPLVEITTAPDIKSAEQAKEAAEHIGMILRSTGKVRRGIGTIRQDVNLSIKGGQRVELKGFQDIRSMPKVIEKEVERQLRLLSQKKRVENEVRKVNPDNTTTFLRPMPGAARMYPETDIRPVKPDLKGIVLPKLISEELAELEKRYKVGKDKIKLLKKEDVFGENRLFLFEELVKNNKNVKPAFICETLLSYPRKILRKHKGADPFKIKKEDLSRMFEKLNENKIPKDAVFEILLEVAKGKKPNYSKYKAASTGDVEKEIKKLVEEKPDVNIGGLMGLVMAKFKGKVDGKTAMEILRKYKK